MSALSTVANLQTSVSSAAIRKPLNLFQSAGSAAKANVPLATTAPAAEPLLTRGGGAPAVSAPSSKAPAVIGVIAVALAGVAAFLLLRKKKGKRR